MFGAGSDELASDARDGERLVQVLVPLVGERHLVGTTRLLPRRDRK